jgi:ADP-ribosylglycohydrolase
MSDFLSELAKECPPQTPFRFLRFTWFGDFACSSGEHYEPGNKLSFEQILKLVNKDHSDDLVENMACWIIRPQVPARVSAFDWQNLCWKFYDYIKEDYLKAPVRYSPDYAQLFASQDESDYIRVITHHDNCGGAMRSASLAWGGATPHEHLSLAGMTHLHPEALSGAYALYEAVRALKAGASVAELWDAAFEAAWQGEKQSAEIMEAWNVTGMHSSLTLQWLRDAHRHNDPRYSITDWRGEGISTRFVVSGAMQIAAEAMRRDPKDALRFVVERAIEVGGDPDTLGSMSMALAGAFFGEALHEQIDDVLNRLLPPEAVEVPEFFS